MAYFIPCSKTSDTSYVAKLYGLSKTIVFDKDVLFMSYIWNTFWHIVDRKLKFSITYHPQIDGQTKVVIMSLGNLLRCLVGESSHNWNSILPIVEFAYNSSVNRSTSMSPYEIVHLYIPRKPIDLIPINPYVWVNATAESFAQHIHDLHDKISKQIQASNE